ncbi:hypothetical protein GGR57DRAFT_77622 [Xylariaceae sp. FL1272]|nr:hypothetical protein GGR57DRAFT_77622 [Xylariaceae sp. FL1272]
MYVSINLSVCLSTITFTIQSTMSPVLQQRCCSIDFSLSHNCFASFSLHLLRLGQRAPARWQGLRLTRKPNFSHTQLIQGPCPSPYAGKALPCFGEAVRFNRRSSAPLIARQIPSAATSFFLRRGESGNASSLLGIYHRPALQRRECRQPLRRRRRIHQSDCRSLHDCVTSRSLLRKGA